MSYEDDLSRLLREINRSTERFATPPEGFNPLKARTRQLTRFGIPPMPDRRREPAAYAFWQRMHAEPISFPDVEFGFAPSVAQNIQSAGVPFARSRYQSSRNWSGAYITPRDGRMFTEILGSWKVPNVSVPAGMPPSDEYASSTWIGFDGQRRYLDSTLPQAGSGQYINLNGVPGATATSWLQWWPGPPLTLLGVPVNFGDEMMCWLTVISSTQVILRIKNATTMPGPYLPFLWTAPTVPLPHPPSPIQAKVSGATAEWVMERPAKWPTDELFELPDYGSVAFTDAIGRTATGPGQPTREETLFGARIIRMYRVAQGPHRAQTVSTAKRLGPHELTASYKH